MTDPTWPGGPRHVRCPICAADYEWPTDSQIVIFDEDKQDYELHDLAKYPPASRPGLVVRGYRACPNPFGDTPPHYLPATYADHQTALVIGLVGSSNSGKTHLLTAMLRQAYQGGLGHYGIRALPLDFRRHAAFRERYVKPFEEGVALPGTDTGIIEAADIMLLRGPGNGTRPVVFFDVAGEDLESTSALNRATRFLDGVNAVIFVHGSEDPLETGRPAEGENQSFHLAVERLQGKPGGATQLPAAIAVTKSDRLRYVPPADRWLRRGDENAVNADRIRAECRDAYAYLSWTGAGTSLLPFDTFQRCTLHFVSASGGDAVPVAGEQKKMYFPRGVRPTRVLEPLIAILAMTGVITGPEADKVGMP
jgi:Double-GTPase 2